MKVAANSDFQALSFEHERAPFDLKVKWAWGEKKVLVMEYFLTSFIISTKYLFLVTFNGRQPVDVDTTNKFYQGLILKIQSLCHSSLILKGVF